MTALVLSYLAGLLTTLNPCVLPVLPLVIAGTMTGGRFGPLAFAGGMVASFTLVGLFVASIGFALGLTPELLRQVAALMFVAFGLVLLVPPLQARFALATAGLANGAGNLTARVQGAGGNWGGGLGAPLLTGALAGALWSPCSGPSLGAAVALAAEAGGFGQAALRMFVFGLGAATVLVLLAYGSRAAIMRRRDALMSGATWIKPVAGLVFVALGLAVLAGFDKTLEIALLDLMPDWLTDLTTRF
jgi:cytochrome c biogenesis protein CcdA